MPKPSLKEKILTEGLRVVHRHGFAGSSVRDIVQAADVPQGSFTNHFSSKEAFGLEILERYFANTCEERRKTLLNDGRPPLERMRAYIEGVKMRLKRERLRNGCLFGNFSAESSDHSEPIRARLVEIFADVRASFAYCLRAAVAAGEVSAALDCDEVAGFIVSSMQGAILISKSERALEPVERFEHVLFSLVLRQS